jgi:hypothetical protein
VERDTRCAFAISSGTPNMPKNYFRTRLGVGLCIADAVGRHLLSADANGMTGAMTDISPPRWSEQREHKYPPNDWSNGYVWDFDGTASNTPADVPWHLIPGMECRPENVALEYVEPLCYSVQPNGLTLLGIKEMQEKSATIGNTAFITGLDQSTQSVPEDQQPAYLAAQCWDHDFAGRVMITMKILQETRGTMSSWPQLDEARVAEALRPNLGGRESHGSAAFPPGFVFPLPGGDDHQGKLEILCKPTVARDVSRGFPWYLAHG